MTDWDPEDIETLDTVKAELESIEKELGAKLGLANRYRILMHDLENPALPHGELVDRWQEYWTTYLWYLAEDADEKTSGQAAYDAYGRDAGFKTFDGKAMPRWTEEEAKEAGAQVLTDVIKGRWEVSARAILARVPTCRCPRPDPHAEQRAHEQRVDRTAFFLVLMFIAILVYFLAK
jgi:hypothetical protein